MGYPAGTVYKIPITVSAAKVAGALSYFPYQIDLSAKLVSDAVFKSHIATSSNIAVYDPVSDTSRPKIAFLDLITDKLLIYFDAPASTSADKVFFVCVGSGVNAVDVITPWTNSGYTNYFTFNEFGDNTVADFVGVLAPTIDGTKVARTTGIFGNGLALTTDDASVLLGDTTALNGVATFSIGFVVSFAGSKESKLILRKFTNSSTAIIVQTEANGNLQVRVANGAATTGTTSGFTFDLDTKYAINITYDGSGATNADKLKIYVNGVPISLTFSGTLPATTATTASMRLGFTSTSLQGTFDELSIASVALPASFAATRYNQFFDAGFWSVGSGVSGAATSAIVSPSSASVVTGKTKQFTVAYYAADGLVTTMHDPTVWSVDDGGVIDEDTGLFTAGAVVGGPFTVTATAGLISDTATVNVIESVNSFQPKRTNFKFKVGV